MVCCQLCIIWPHSLEVTKQRVIHRKLARAWHWSLPTRLRLQSGPPTELGSWQTWQGLKEAKDVGLHFPHPCSWRGVPSTLYSLLALQDLVLVWSGKTVKSGSQLAVTQQTLGCKNILLLEACTRSSAPTLRISVLSHYRLMLLMPFTDLWFYAFYILKITSAGLILWSPDF